MTNCINEYTAYLFSCQLADNAFAPEGQEDHLKNPGN